VDTFQLTAEDARADDNYALHNSAMNGHLDVVKYLVGKFQLTSEDTRARGNYALRTSAENGHLGVVKYLVDHFHSLEDVKTILPERIFRSCFGS
jgi:ankyrin repeat protein